MSRCHERNHCLRSVLDFFGWEQLLWIAERRQSPKLSLQYVFFWSSKCPFLGRLQNLRHALVDLYLRDMFYGLTIAHWKKC